MRQYFNFANLLGQCWGRGLSVSSYKFHQILPFETRRHHGSGDGNFWVMLWLSLSGFPGLLPIFSESLFFSNTAWVRGEEDTKGSMVRMHSFCNAFIYHNCNRNSICTIICFASCLSHDTLNSPVKSMSVELYLPVLNIVPAIYEAFGEYCLNE